jgi:hypothetical protein
MNTRILRMCRRIRYYPYRIVVGLGQTHQVTFSISDDGDVSLQCEGVNFRGDCDLVDYSLKRDKQAAKNVFAELELCKAEGTLTPAAKAWDKYVKNLKRQM